MEEALLDEFNIRINEQVAKFQPKQRSWITVVEELFVSRYSPGFRNRTVTMAYAMISDNGKLTAELSEVIDTLPAEDQRRAFRACLQAEAIRDSSERSELINLEDSGKV